MLQCEKNLYVWSYSSFLSKPQAQLHSDTLRSSGITRKVTDYAGSRERSECTDGLSNQSHVLTSEHDSYELDLMDTRLITYDQASLPSVVPSSVLHRVT